MSARAPSRLDKGYAPIFTIAHRWITADQPILRLEIIRILAPLAILGFMSGRLWHADELLGVSGFHPPAILQDDYRQPLYVAPLSDGVAWVIALVMVVAGLSVSLGYRTRFAAATFAVTLAFVALADRLAAFTVSKMSPAILIAIALSPAGTRYGVDAWLRRRRSPEAPLVTEASSGAIRFLQAFLVVMYFGSGTAKAKKEWFAHRVPHLLWTHVHDSYQTWFSWAFANAMPNFAWDAFQWLVLVLEIGAPIWFVWRRSRPVALVLALGMHAMIGLMFGPVKWFAMLMMVLLLGGFLPDSVLARIERALGTRLG